MKANDLKIAFIGWNPFQLIYVSALIKQIPNSVFILENRNNSLSQFNKSLLSQTNVPVKVYKSNVIYKLDDLYDIIVCQSVFTDIHRFKKAKITMIQYGYAKEAHNYGAWRSLADLCFTYGSYASEKISYFCPTIEIGYLRKDEVRSPDFSLKAKQKYNHLLDKNKRTVLYLPTWGEENSSEEYLDSVLSLRKNYNILIKPHHNTDLLSQKKSANSNAMTPFLLGVNDDSLELISVSDIVISDYSGAIFDAIFFKKPIVLVNPVDSFKGSNKVDEYSIEYCRRDELGYVVDKPSDLHNAINESLSNNNLISDKLFRHLYYEGNTKAHFKIYKELVKLAQIEKPILSQQQLYIRVEIKKLCAIKYSSLKDNIISTLLSFYSKIMKKPKC